MVWKGSGWSRRAVLGAAVGGLAMPSIASARPRAAPFTIGILGHREPPELALKTLRRTMRSALAREIAFETFARGERLVEASATGRIAVSVHTALTFAATRIACDCLQPLARPVTASGEAGLRSAILVRADGDLQRMDDVAGRTVLGGGDGSIPAKVARIALRHRLRGEAVPLHVGTDARDDVSRFLAGAGDALIGHEVLDRFGTALAGKGTLAKLHAEEAGEFRTIWRSGRIWHGPVALHREHAHLAAPLRGVLLTMPTGGAETIGLGLGRVSLDPAVADEYDLLPHLLRADA